MRAPTAAFKTWAPPTEEHFDLYEWQDGRCGFCGRNAGDRLVEDHCHFTGLVRGYLCRPCNSQEGWGSTNRWDGWRAGDNAAAAFKQFEIYIAPWGGHTPITSRGALHYYSPAEREAWFVKVVADLNAGKPWPEDAPWTAEALARKEAVAVEMSAALGRMDSLLRDVWSA